MEMRSTELYIKRNGKYEYWGEYDSLLDVYLPQGLWIVTRTKNSHGIQFIPQDDDEIIVPIEIQRRHRLKEKILRVISDTIGEVISYDQLAARIAKTLMPPKKRTKDKRFKVR